nr:hypothetical protein [Tanacetum cinerariifolium]
MKYLKEKVKDKLVKQDPSLQTVHMLCQRRLLYNDHNKVAIGYKNPLCLTCAKQAQPALYNGHESLKDNHAPAKVHNTEDTLEIAEITRKKINAKMTDPECVIHKVKIVPHDYSKKNLLATFTPQKQLTPEQIYWSNDLMKLKSEALKERAKVSKPIKAFTVSSTGRLLSPLAGEIILVLGLLLGCDPLALGKKQVTAPKPSDRQDSNKNQQKTNVPVPHSTGVKRYPKASGSLPKSNHNTNRISPAKGANKLPVEDLPRTNKSHLRTTNRVDSSSRLKRTPALYNGHEIIKDNHAPAIVHNTEDTLEIAKITRKKMNAKMNDPECGIQKALTKEIKEMKDVFEELEAEVAQYAVDRKHDAIKRKNLLTANDNLITECLSQEVFSVATNSELNVARFTKMHVSNTIIEAHCLALEAELANLSDKSHHDNQEELINHFSKLEVNHLNLQLKYQNLKDSIGNNPPTPDKDTPNFNLVFVIGKMQAFLQGKDNVIRQLKKQLSQLQVTRSDTDCTLKVRTTDSHITKLTDQVSNLQAQNDLFRAENDKIKQHYKELYDSIKITRTKHIEQVTKLTTENVNLKTSVNKDKVKPQVLAREKHAIDVEPVVPRLRNKRDAHLDYLRHPKESVETICDIVEEAKVLAHIPLIRKKQVTIAKSSDKSDSTTHRHVVTVKSQQTNVPVPPSTGVNSCPNARGSQPKRNVKPNRISPTKGVNKLPVEDQPRIKKSQLRTSNRVDSSSRLKRT